MARVVVGIAGDEYLIVDSDICVKSGRRTSDRVTLRGGTTPGWVNVLLLFSILGWLFASGMSTRRYRMEVPFSHAIHARWRRWSRVAWLVGVGGLVVTIFAAAEGVQVEWMLLCVAVTALGMGLGNAFVNNVGVRENRDNELVLTRVHPTAAAALTRAGSVRS